ncbi:Bromodomain-containing protein [Cladophialophora immunda]|nr:Bromodomain-containing protein [Cladophialophora immunda]
MTSADLHTALLRPAVLQILRAAGFSSARPVVIDTVTDLAARYLLLLASSTAQNAFNTHNTFVPTIQDVRLALTQAGALAPQMNTVEESLRGDVEVVEGVWVPFEDLRGVEAFVNWAYGPVNKEIRRIAGFGDDVNVEEIAAALDEQEDYLSALKKRHSKTGEASATKAPFSARIQNYKRYQSWAALQLRLQNGHNRPWPAHEPTPACALDKKRVRPQRHLALAVHRSPRLNLNEREIDSALLLSIPEQTL